MLWVLPHPGRPADSQATVLGQRGKGISLCRDPRSCRRAARRRPSHLPCERPVSRPSPAALAQGRWSPLWGFLVTITGSDLREKQLCHLLAKPPPCTLGPTPVTGDQKGPGTSRAFCRIQRYSL